MPPDAREARIERDTMTECCGQKCESRYCPNCGKQLVKHDLGTLLNHCQTQAAKCKEDCRKKPDFKGTKEASYEKWKTWAELLEAVVDTTADKAK